MIETEMYTTLFGPLLFGMCAGVWGFFQRPDKHTSLLAAMTLLFVFAAIVYARFPSDSLFYLLALNGFVLTSLNVLMFRPKEKPLHD